jgi:2-methylcitrate dehydratase PrpD
MLDKTKDSQPLNQTQTLAKYAANLRYEDIPANVLERQRNTICDALGAMVFGYRLPWSQMLVNYAMAYGPGGKARILGPGGALVQPPAAAFVNGGLAHSFELDGSTKPSVGVHPCATIFPAALAVAQERGFGGKELLTACVAATEVVLRIGDATHHSNEIRGFHAPGTTGPFAATVAVGKLLGFDTEKMTNALGIAASLACGLVQFSRSGTGGMVKRLHFARANESGVLAANLAERGFTGPHDIIEGEFGFLRVFCNEFEEERLTRGLGETWMSMTIYMKRFACHGAAQGQLQALQDIQAEHKFSPSDVDSIEVGGHHEMWDRHNIPEPQDPMIAQYSVNFAIALGLFHNPRDPRTFNENTIKDPQILAMCKKVKLYKEEGAGHMTPGATVTIKLKDGRVLTKHVVYFKGTPQNPANRDDVHEKFSLLTGDCPRDKMDEIFNRLQNIESENNFDWLKV